MPLCSHSELASIIFPPCHLTKPRHYSPHMTGESLWRSESPSCQCQTQAQKHQHLPVLLQRPRLCRPVPSTSSPVAGPVPLICKDRRKSPSSTASDVLSLMDALQLPVDSDTYVSLLKECARSGDLLQGAAVHAHIRHHFTAERSLLRQPVGLGLANRLLLMYAACGETKIVHRLFDQMFIRDSISRVITMTALSENNDDLEALRLFVGMHPGREDWWVVDPKGFRVVLWTCTRVKELGLGKQLHCLAIKLTGCFSFAEHSAPLINFYAMLGCPDLSMQLLSACPGSDGKEVAWGSIISAFCNAGCFRKALLVFKEMESRSVTGGFLKKGRRCKTLASFIAACMGASKDKERYDGGRHGHAIAVKIGLDGDAYVGCSLVELYSKIGLLAEARRAFETVGGDERDAACWNAMLGGYARVGNAEEKLLFMHEMKVAGIELHDTILNQLW